ncbi:MAG TPA: DeoR/GlpR transcriptional regulator [Anaerolineae bacterium]|nr:DeoR/GlpR transcriptional regulator [Anaerolineae bacterium]HIQ06752.1 DeoR/GlpR transcriptional regulator [Anaerolineae bacterium]
MVPEERRQHILQIVANEGSVSVADLCHRFDVSEMTIRRDLRLLESEGLLRRVHGGAVSGRGRSFEPPFLLRAGEQQAEKERIGKRAAALVEDGDSIALDVGTTTLEVARHLRDKTDLTVITTSLPIATVLANQPNIRLIVTGGILRPGEQSLIGELAIRAFQDFYVDKAFIGIGGIAWKEGLTEYNLEDAQVKKALIRSAKERIVVTDASKFGRVTFAAVAPLNEIDKIVTDALPDARLLAALKEMDIEIIVAD